MPAPPRRVAWVTGGGRGIGRAAALALAEHGCDVGLTARSTDELAEAAAAVRALGRRAAAAPADVTDAGRVQAAYGEVAGALGPPDILVNAAGMARSAPFLKTSVGFLEQHWRLNLLGTFLATQCALPAMLDRGWGRVVNVASIAGKVGAPYIAAYSSSKHAVLGLTRSLATEVAAKGVTVNAVCPGYVDTKMTQDNVAFIAERTRTTREEALRRIAELSPQKRLLQPEEVAACIAFLASDAAGGINGQAYTLDGGAVQA